MGQSFSGPGQVNVDVFTTVVGIVIAGIALFIGYRIGVKDGFRGGFQSGRTLERQLAVEQRRLITARTVREGALLQTVLEQKALPTLQAAGEVAENATAREWNGRGDGAMQYDSYEQSRL